MAKPPVHLNGAIKDLPLIMGGRDGKGAPKPLMANAIMVLKAAPAFFNLRFDEFSQSPFRGEAKLTDADFLDITNWMQLQGIHADVRIVTNAILHVAGECRFHQVKDYLSGLRWDGLERLDKVFVDHGGAADTALTHAMTAKWHIQAVARVFEPGCKADYMLILEGIQGLKKSWYFDIMGRPWFIDSISDLTSKDAKQEIRGIWIVEMAEMNNLRKAEANHIKSFMTTKSDHYRDSYGRVTQDYPRQCVLAGTINPGAEGYLKDPTGARRFWPISIVEEIDRDLIAAKKDQLWAEAVHRYRAGEAWYLDKPELVAAVTDAQNARYEGDLWEGPIATFLEGRTTVTTAEILTDCLLNKLVADWGKAEQMRVGAVLTSLGWTRIRKRINQRPVNVYSAPLQLGESVEVGTLL